MSKVFGYIRVSGLGQVDKDGPKRQKDAIVDFCSKHGLDLSSDSIYEEKGVSGTIEGSNRPAFSTMFARIAELRESGMEVVGFVCERLDRLARTLHVSEILLEECRKFNLAVYATDQGDTRDMASDGGDPMRVLLRQFIGALNEYQKSELVKKLKLARERMRKEKGYCEGRKPYGTEKGEAPCLQTIAMLHQQGDTDAAIAATLNGLGFLNRKGATWSRQAVRKQIRHKHLTKLRE